MNWLCAPMGRYPFAILQKHHSLQPNKEIPSPPTPQSYPIHLATGAHVNSHASGGARCTEIDSDSGS